MYSTAATTAHSSVRKSRTWKQSGGSSPGLPVCGGGGPVATRERPLGGCWGVLGGAGLGTGPASFPAAEMLRQQRGSAPSDTERAPDGAGVPEPLSPSQRVLTSVFILGGLPRHRAGSGGHREGGGSHPAKRSGLSGGTAG